MRVPGAQPLHATGDWKISSLDYGQLAVAELLRSAQRPTAILAGNDEIAAGIWKELVRRQVRIPTEISLIGFGDRAEFSILEPSLTSVRTFEETLGERLATMLLQRFAAGARSLPSESYPCQLIERHSCAAPPPSPAALKRVFARGAI
jgi:DNA-binding LacI/PurR family transcriptional regulator